VDVDAVKVEIMRSEEARPVVEEDPGWSSLVRHAMAATEQFIPASVKEADLGRSPGA